MRIGLEGFISNLEYLSTDVATMVEEEIIEVFWQVLKEMSLLTIMDTGQAKSAIVQVFAERYGKDISEVMVEPIYDIWGNHPDRSWGNAKIKHYKDRIQGKEATVNMAIHDHGLYAQENRYPTHPSESDLVAKAGRDNSIYKKGHITWVADNFDTLESFKKAINDMCDEIESKLFQKSNRKIYKLSF